MAKRKKDDAVAVACNIALDQSDELIEAIPALIEIRDSPRGATRTQQLLIGLTNAVAARLSVAITGVAVALQEEALGTPPLTPEKVAPTTPATPAPTSDSGPDPAADNLDMGEDEARTAARAACIAKDAEVGDGFGLKILRAAGIKTVIKKMTLKQATRVIALLALPVEFLRLYGDYGVDHKPKAVEDFCKAYGGFGLPEEFDAETRAVIAVAMKEALGT